MRKHSTNSIELNPATSNMYADMSFGGTPSHLLPGQPAVLGATGAAGYSGYNGYSSTASPGDGATRTDQDIAAQQQRQGRGSGGVPTYNPGGTSNASLAPDGIGVRDRSMASIQSKSQLLSPAPLHYPFP